MWILFTIAFSFAIFLLYNLLKMYVLPKVKVNRWIILALAIIALIVPSFFPVQNLISMAIQSGVFVILFLWFIDLTKLRREEAKKIKIKPKAKPNRVKYKDEKKK